MKLDYRHSGENGMAQSVFAIVCFAVSILMLLCLPAPLFVPAGTFNSLDPWYRRAILSYSGIPALFMLFLNWFARRRVKRKGLGGLAWTTAGIVITAFGFLGALLGLGLFGID